MKNNSQMLLSIKNNFWLNNCKLKTNIYNDWINFLLHEEFNKFLGNAYIKLMSEATLGRRYLYLTVLVYISVESQYIFFHIIPIKFCLYPCNLTFVCS